MTFLAYSSANILSPAQPPTLVLSGSDTAHLRNQLQHWGRILYGDKAYSRQMLKALLVYIFSRHFFARKGQMSEPAPLWLEHLIQAMKKPENFIEGRTALLTLANRTPEYVGRMFKKYLKVTPSQFINDLRLDYASDLLLTTDDSPTVIAYEAGFGNLSHFYHLFKLRWHCSPNQYRNQHQRTLLP